MTSEKSNIFDKENIRFSRKLGRKFVLHCATFLMANKGNSKEILKNDFKKQKKLRSNLLSKFKSKPSD